MANSTERLKRIKKTSNGRLKLRYMAVLHFLEGQSRAAISRFLKVRRFTVNDWIKAYLNEGLDALIEKPRTGRTPKLTEQQKNQLYNFVVDAAKSTEGGRLTGQDIQRFIHQQFGINYHQSNIYKLLSKLELRWITSRSKHPKQSQVVQEAFKKNSIAQS